MKLSISCFSLISLAAMAMSKEYVAGYDALQLGAFHDNPFKGLNYSSKWSVGRSTVQVSNLKRHSPKVLFSGMRETGEHFGSITRADRERFDPKSVLLACSGPKKRGRKTTVPCNVLIEGTKNDGLGIPKVMTVEYNKTSQMQRFYLDDVSNVNTLSFSITQAGKDGKLKKDVTLVLDTFDYEFDDGGE